MNASHYPSIKLCQELTEIGFPKTEFSVNSIPWMLFNSNNTTKKEWMSYCPSVMEILDNINLWSCYELIIKKQYDDDYDSWYCHIVEFKYIEGCTMKSFKWNLPDSLSNMYIWLFKSRYIL